MQPVTVITVVGIILFDSQESNETSIISPVHRILVHDAVSLAGFFYTL